MSKMTVIQLLNKIANREELPKEIKVNDNIYYYDETDCNEFYRYRTMVDELLTDYADLNDEVEIIEDKPKDKKIEKLDLEDDGNTITLFGEKENEWTILDNVDIIVCNKINEIIDKINGE